MSESTSAVSEEDLVRHFKEFLAPYVCKVQLPGTGSAGKGDQTSVSSCSGPDMKQDFIDSFGDTLLLASRITPYSPKTLLGACSTIFGGKRRDCRHLCPAHKMCVRNKCFVHGKLGQHLGHICAL